MAALALCAAPVVVALERGRSAGPAHSVGALAERPREKTDAERFAMKNSEVITEKEWEETVAFLKVHSPHRFAQVKMMAKPHENLKRHLVNQYRSIANLQQEQPRLYSTRVRSIEVEDEIFGLCRQLQHGEGDRQQKQAELKAKVSEMVSLSIEERGQRIDYLEKALVDQKKTLDTDKKDKDRLVNDRYQYFLTHGVVGARFDLPRKGKGKNASSTSPSPGETE